MRNYTKSPRQICQKLVDSIEFAGVHECWNWKPVPTNAGYGLFHIGKETWGYKFQGLAHRFIYQIMVGPIPPEIHLCHRCDNPRCVNPNHLFAGSAKDNYLDSVAKGRSKRQAKTLCSKGHPWSLENTGINSTNKGRFCLICKREKDRIYSAKNRSILAAKQRERKKRLQQAKQLALQT